MKVLLDRGLDEQHRDNAGWGPLHYAAFEGIFISISLFPPKSIYVLIYILISSDEYLPSKAMISDMFFILLLQAIPR